MHAFAPRPYLAPVRDEEAESQRKAKSRHARQTRRSTQGVTLTDLREAQKSLSPLDWRTEDGGAERSCRRKGSADGRRVESNPETADPSELGWTDVDEEGNVQAGSETFPRCQITSLSPRGPTGGEEQRRRRRRHDENQNPIEEAAPVTFDTDPRGDALMEHERLSRYDSSGDGAAEKPLGRTSSYTRRETRLAALKGQDQEESTKDYKKMYAEALQENERLKSRLQDSKQELVKIRSQLEKITQRQDRISEKSSALESEKREKQALEKRVSGMEEDLKVLNELKSDNQRLKDENGALIRVISKLSK